VVELYRIGGVPIVMKMLLDAGLLHGDCLTVTGHTVAENLKDVKLPANFSQQDVIYPISKPLAPPGQHIIILHVSRMVRSFFDLGLMIFDLINLRAPCVQEVQ